MLFAVPELSAQDQEMLDRLDGLRSELAHQVAVPRRWLGSLRRLTFARAVQASNSIRYHREHGEP